MCGAAGELGAFWAVKLAENERPLLALQAAFVNRLVLESRACCAGAGALDVAIASGVRGVVQCCKAILALLLSRALTQAASLRDVIRPCGELKRRPLQLLALVVARCGRGCGRGRGSRIVVIIVVR